MDGRELSSDRSRVGYMAMTGRNQVIGIGRSEKVKDYVKDEGGSFFRQFILVNNCRTPERFVLKKMAVRRAIGNLDGTLYYIGTRHKETMWDFAEALRRYGFTDAIYITGGDDYSYYRSADGTRHDIGDPAAYPHTTWQGVIPWLVFRRAE